MNVTVESRARPCPGVKRAIAMAEDFKKAELLVKPEKETLKPGESREFSAALKIGKQTIPIKGDDVAWSHGGGTFTAEKSMAGKFALEKLGSPNFE